MSPPMGAARVSTFSSLPDAIPDSGVARWTFDNDDTNTGTAVDVWNGNDGTINGATTGVSGANQTYTTNEAYSFDGTDDDVVTSDILDPNPTVSVACWFKTSTASKIFGKAASNDFQYRASVESDGTVLIRVYLSDGSVAADASGSAVVDDGNWHHITITLEDATSVTLYVDGSQDASSTVGSMNNNGAAPFTIGQRGDDVVFFDGDIDDVRGYDKILSGTEVSNLYNTGSI